jgi:hypothetical protein
MRMLRRHEFLHPILLPVRYSIKDYLDLRNT